MSKKTIEKEMPKRNALERMSYFKSFYETEEALPTVEAKYALHVVLCKYGFENKEIEEAFAEPPLSELELNDTEKQFVRVGFNGCYKQIDKSADRIIHGYKGGRSPGNNSSNNSGSSNVAEEINEVDEHLREQQRREREELRARTQEY